MHPNIACVQCHVMSLQKKLGWTTKNGSECAQLAKLILSSFFRQNSIELVYIELGKKIWGDSVTGGLRTGVVKF